MIDLTGKQVGRLIVKEYVGPAIKFGFKTKGTAWKCICSCGSEVVKKGRNLVTEDVNSCGCLAVEYRTSNRTSDEQCHNTYVIKSVRNGAKNRDIQCLLTDEQILEYSKKDCEYCYMPPQNMSRRLKQGLGYQPLLPWNGIDRVDNSLGYMESNCVTACFRCNIAKRSLGHEEFINWINAIRNVRN